MAEEKAAEKATEKEESVAPPAEAVDGATEGAPPVPKKKKKKKKKKKAPEGPKQPSLGARIAGAMVGIGKGFKEIATATLAPDWRSRRMALLFFLSMIGTGATLIASVQWMMARFKPSHSQEETERLKAEAASILKQKTEEEKKVGFQLNIGKFLVGLQNEEEPKSNYGVVDMAELEIVVECEEDETCSYLKANAEKTRDQVTKILVSLTKEELLSLEGKNRLKEVIKRNLMSWMGQGKIRKVFFTKVLMG